jgi:hypothetical protein
MEDAIEIVIQVKGGLIESAYSIDCKIPVKIKILDWDIQDEPRPISFKRMECISTEEYEEMEKLFTKMDIKEEVS